MAHKSNFSDEEWKAIMASPMMASTAVTLADPNGLWGVLKEGMTGARTVLEARNDPGANDLIKALVADMETSEGREAAREGLKAELTAKSPTELKDQALAGLGRVSQILDKKAPGDAVAFKTWLNGVAERVASAASEGGFLGFGGVKVSDAEKASLSEIAKTLNVA